MNKPRILLALVWLGSLAAAYFIGSVGDSTRHPVPSIPAEATAPEAAARGTPIPHSRAGEAADEATAVKPDVRQLIARARLEMGSGMGGMMNIRGMLRAIAPIAELDGSQIQEALVEVEKTVREPQQKMMLYSLLLGQWAETDGPAAMAYAQAKLEKGSMFDMGVTSSVLGTWARRDPEAAWKWFQAENPDGGSDRTRMMALNSIFAGLAANNLEAALTRVGTLDEQSRGMALSGIAAGMMDEASRRRLIERTASLPPDQKAQLRQSLVIPWAMGNADEAVAWIRSLPADEQKPLRSMVSMNLMNMKPALGAELMLEGAEEKDRPQIYDNIAMQWAAMDARAAGEWLTKQPQGPELDGARASYARGVIQRDPSVAMDWARSVQDEKRRTESVTSVYQMWRMKDPAAAAAALAAAGLPPDQAQQIRDLPPLQSTTGETATPVRSYGK